MSETTTTSGVTFVEEMTLRDAPTYDEFTGLMQVKYRYRVGLGMEAALLMPFDQALLPTGPDQIAANLSINRTMPDGSIVPINLVPVQRDVQEIQADHAGDKKPRQTELIVTYEGHLCLYPTYFSTLISSTTPGVDDDATIFDGIFSAWWEDNEQTEKIILSFDLDANGNRIGIGPNNEGVNRSIPTSVLCIRQNISLQSYIYMRRVIQNLLSKVNEEGWQVAYNDAAQEGEFRYVPPQLVENRDGSFTITHRFERDNGIDETPTAIGITTTAGAAATRRGHKARYYNEKSTKVALESGVKKEVKTAVGEEVLRKIYLVAGTDIGYKFADLFKTPCA